jgi:hypothetical protein
MSLNHLLLGSRLANLNLECNSITAGTGIFTNLIAPSGTGTFNNVTCTTLTCGTGTFISESAGTGIFNNVQFTNNTSGYVPGTLSYYEDKTIQNLAFGGATTLNASGTFSRLGSLVSLGIPAMSFTAGANTYLSTSSGAIPARFRPATSQYFFCEATTPTTAPNGAAGQVSILNTGEIDIFATAAGDGFHTGGVSTVQPTTISWLLI